VDYGGALLGALARRHPDVPFVLTPPPGRADEAGRIAGAAGAPNVIVHPPLPHVLDLVSLLRRAALVLTPDTANVHLAAAAGRPVLGLYTARTTDPAAWAPLGVPSRALLSPDRAPVTAIPVDAVLAAFDALWDETAAREPAARGTAASALSGAPAGPTPPTA
jgi:ADP-heptose:LPS heptosyltransferase